MGEPASEAVTTEDGRRRVVFLRREAKPAARF